MGRYLSDFSEAVWPVKLNADALKKRWEAPFNGVPCHSAR